MPMIDLKATDSACILSTMHFVAEQSSKYNMTPVPTFDQPLYWKSMSIKEQQDESSVLKKGCAENRRLSPNDEFSWFNCI